MPTALFGRLKRFLLIYILLMLLVVLSFGALGSVTADSDRVRAFLTDIVVFAPGAFLAYWMASVLSERALDATADMPGFKALGWAMLLAVMIGVAFLAAGYVARTGWAGWESLQMVTSMFGSLSFLKPGFVTGTWQLFDQLGNRTNELLLPLQRGGPAQFKLVSYHSQFALFFSVVAEALFAFIVATWLLIYRSYDGLRSALVGALNVKKHPYFFAVLPPVLFLELIGLAIALMSGVMAASPS